MNNVKIYVDLEKTLIDTELNPILLDNNKELLTKLLSENEIGDIIIFSSIISTENDATVFMKSVLKKTIEDFFNVNIISAVPINLAWENFSPEFTKPTKETLFISYITNCVGESGTYYLIDDTVNDKVYHFGNNKKVVTIRGL